MSFALDMLPILLICGGFGYLFQYTLLAVAERKLTKYLLLLLYAVCILWIAVHFQIWHIFMLPNEEAETGGMVLLLYLLPSMAGSGLAWLVNGILHGKRRQAP